MRRIQRALDDASRADLLSASARDALAAIHRADPAGIGLDGVRPARRMARPARRDGRHHGDVRVGVPLAGREPTAAVAERVGARRLPDGQPDHRHRRAARPGSPRCSTGSSPTPARSTRTWRGSASGRGASGRRASLGAGGLGSIEDFLRAYEDASGTVARPRRDALVAGAVDAALGRHLPLPGRAAPVRSDALGRTGRDRPPRLRDRVRPARPCWRRRRDRPARPTHRRRTGRRRRRVPRDRRPRRHDRARSTSTPASPPTCCAPSNANCSTTPRPSPPLTCSASPTSATLAAAIRTRRPRRPRRRAAAGAARAGAAPARRRAPRL